MTTEKFAGGNTAFGSGSFFFNWPVDACCSLDFRRKFYLDLHFFPINISGFTSDIDPHLIVRTIEVSNPETIPNPFPSQTQYYCQTEQKFSFS